ncbi:glycosyl hydrolase family 8 [Psychromonas sp. 14N.309.X.WAT.B.A12]|uniref:glycosyl hydrolase family 8 n=1 Tax=Psychromonas sp. 14N.309.X.WAT.B.A12 TaxID=2998322 RepID=UPI0025B1A23C|nr:glycosyl hydrolase family 8 [Psychromonas sp. 14N.309.X.WAT.B.A12]MDN2661800.1 glycosyl hydrolase family 8 [Psychromonas sp. 14N.309.X.WAT.B.A12]
MKSIKYVVILITITILAWTQWTVVELTPFQKSWAIYKTQFIDAGRVIDTGNQNISHSEGQGYALLFAVFADDKDQFKNIWQWTQQTLQRDDQLFSWQYTPSKQQACDDTCITDTNNATDGDILIAWALLEANKKWGISAYLNQAIAILETIKTKLIKDKFGYQLILPGEVGFERPDGSIQINLSYWVFPAFKLFSEVTNDPIWNEVYQSGIALIKFARFSDWQLPSDWVIISDDQVTLSGALSSDYGYNACRIPIYLMLAKDKNRSLIEPFIAFWSQQTVPATVNLENGDVAEYSYNSGMQAIAKSTQSIINEQPEALPEVDDKTDYYSASLILLSQLALLKSDLMQ